MKHRYHIGTENVTKEEYFKRLEEDENWELEVVEEIIQTLDGHFSNLFLRKRIKKRGAYKKCKKELSNTNRFECKYCHTKFFYKYDAEKCEYSHAQGHILEINFKIFNNLRNKRDKLSMLRKKLCVYRLYKYENLAPKQISKNLGINLHTVQLWTGSIFRLLCESDNKCVFRKYFSETIKKRS